MTQQQQSSAALITREPTALRREIQDLAGIEIKTPQEFAERIRELQGQAHILSPMAAVARIAPSHVINTMVVVIDASVDAKSGRGADVYHQRAIHAGTGRGDTYRPVEVSLNKIGLLKILQASGANVYAPTREFRDRYWWIVTHEADLLTFDGRYVRLPPGTASVDLRDGSADIGEWAPEEWARRVANADAIRERTHKDEQWKVKPDTINGWTYDRVLQSRKFGLELAETKSLNRLARNLGIKAAYTIAELQRPFVMFRASYVPDVSDPEVRRQLTQASLGARHLLFPGAQAQQVPSHEDAPITHGMGDPTQVFAGEVVAESEPAEPIETAGLPDDAEELVFDEPKAQTSANTYHVLKGAQRGKGEAAQYFFETQEGVTLYTPDLALAKALKSAVQDGQPREIPTDRVMVAGQPYRQALEVTAAGGLKL
jgi:hypothetical protein